MNPSVLQADDGPALPRSQLLRSFLGAAAGLCLPFALLFWFQPASLNLAQHLVLTLVFGGVGAGALAALRLGQEHERGAVVAVATASIAATVLAAWLVGWGLAAPGIGFLGLLVSITRASTHARGGAIVAGTAAAGVLLLALAEALGWIPGIGGAFAPMPMRVLVALLVVGAGLASGMVVSSVVLSHIRATGEREQRFRSLLGIGADAYWETDAALKVTSISRRGPDGEFLPLDGRAVGEYRLAWEHPGLEFEADVLDLMRAEMESRHRFRDLPLRWRTHRGEVRHLLASGAPRMAPGAQFLGYWGVLRDVTNEVQARQALIATEERYLELFNRMPTPLVLHRQGRIIDANPAALRLFGVERVELLINQPMLRWFEPGDSFNRALDRATRLESKEPGESMPLADYRLVAGGRRLSVKAGAVRVAADAGTATLSFFIDDTERLNARGALARSQELLARVVAMSPDVITLTELGTGRYEMVNASFVRVTGWMSADVVGKTADEIGIWRSADDRERLLRELRERDVVHDMAIDFVARDGRILPMRVSATRFVLEGKPYLVLNARDMSDIERTRLEREAILENAFIGIALTRDNRIVVANPRFEEMFGWERGALVGQPGRAVWPSDERYAEVGREIGTALARGEPVELSSLMARRDGSTFECRIVGKAVNASHPSRGSTIWIAEDVTERRQVELALARARDAAEAASRAKSDFLANTSHEIRTPLNGLVGLARLAREPDLADPLRRRYLEQISDSAEALSAIISDILDLSKIEAGKLALENVAFDLRALLDSLRSAYATMADARGLAFDVEVGPEVPAFVHGDPMRLRQVLSNFLNNALKFTVTGGIRVHVEALEPGRVHFEVLDTGPGIDAETQARLFHPFTQADASTTRRFGGTGLGLSICRELATLMNGKVGVVSSPDRGSCFWADLPLPEASAAESDSGYGALDTDPLRGARVLVVEDNPVNMMIAAAMLQQWGAQVAQAEDGALAVAEVDRAVAAGQPYDVVLMDVQMPGMSGHEATAALRERYDAVRLPIVALTAAALVSEREQALAVGMNDFVTKPIDAKALHLALARVLSLRAEA